MPGPFRSSVPEASSHSSSRHSRSRSCGSLPESGTISASFLGAMVVELTGRTGESPWFDFLNQLRRLAPVVQRQTYLLPDGSLISADEADEDLANAIHQWRCWSYYKLQTKEIPN